MDEVSNDGVQLRFSVPTPTVASPALRAALARLALAVEEEQAGPEVEGFGQRPRVDLGSLAPTPGTATFRPSPTGESWMICISNDDLTCGLFYNSED